MTLIEATLLALVQGITEFLPISSTAHLILLPYLLGWEPHEIHFEIVTNAGTLLAAVVYFRADLMAIGHEATTAPWRSTLLWKVALGTVPVVVVALLFYDWLSTTARQPVIIALASIVFGVLLAWADHVGRRQRNLQQMGWADSWWIGVAQAVALIPGTSRSGITIMAALQRGFTRREAARFSFLLAIPVGVLAFAKDLLDLLLGQSVPSGDLGALTVGFVVSAIAAYFAIDWLLRWLERQTLTAFVIYRVVLGVLILAWVLVD